MLNCEAEPIDAPMLNSQEVAAAAPVVACIMAVNMEIEAWGAMFGEMSAAEMRIAGHFFSRGIDTGIALERMTAGH